MKISTRHSIPDFPNFRFLQDADSFSVRNPISAK